MTASPSSVWTLFRRATAFALAMTAVLMLVASGAAHQMMHADEAPAATQQLAQLDVDPGVTHAPPSSPAKGGHHGAPHGCSGHCAGHAANQPPLLIAMPSPNAGLTVWRADQGVALGDHALNGLERPPRA